jgi:heme-degrading monooxygenase HmoA
VIERHVTFRIRPGKAEEFVSYFGSAYAPAMARQEGFCGAEIIRPDDLTDALVMVLRFASAEAAQAWRDSAAHKELSPTLKSLYQSSEVRVHEVLAEQPGPDRLR